MLKLLLSLTNKVQRGHTLVLSSLQKDGQLVYGNLQRLHQDLQQTSFEHTWKLAHTREAVTRLVTEARQAVEKDSQTTAGAFAALEGMMTIGQLLTQTELEETQRFQQH